MPIIANSGYRAPWYLPGGHAQTIFPSFFRKVETPLLHRLRLDTPDGDFLNLDLGLAAEQDGQGTASAPKAASRVVILSHGLEGNSRRHYMLGMGLAFMRAGWDMAARNFRFCSPDEESGVGEPNLRPKLYHSGETEDLKTVIRFCLERGYRELLLVGFSMGGNQVLKLLGEEGESLPPEVLGAIAVSVPCDLTSSCRALAQGFNRVYVRNFLRTLIRKIKIKHAQMPELFDIAGIDSIRGFKEFDDRYTAPLHGFASAEDYWARASSRRFLSGINRPTLLLNALNDPFLPTECFPRPEAENSRFLFLEAPGQGGHCGFGASGGFFWSERRAVAFATEHFG